MYEKLDIEHWPRKAQFDYFKDYQQPYCNVCTEVDVSKLVSYCKEKNISFTQTSIFAVLRACNQTKEFRYRFEKDGVALYQKVDGRLLILNEDESLSFCHLDYNSDFVTYYEQALKVVTKAKKNKSSFAPQIKRRKDVIHFSVSPWMYLTSVSHPRNNNKGDIPKIVLARYVTRENRIMMPLSVEIHHALMDGYHICKMVKEVQNCLNAPEDFLT